MLNTLRDLVGFKSFTMAEMPMGKPATTKETPTVQRVDKEKLEALVYASPLIFNCINKTTQLVMSPGWSMKTGDSTEDQAEDRWFSRFMENLGSTGEDTDEYTLYEKTYKDQFIYGNAWDELVYYEDRITDVVPIDAKRMDYAKNSGNNTIKLDDYGNVVGYTQTIPYGVEPKKIYPWPEGVSPSTTNSIYLPKDVIAHTMLYTVGDGFYGLGLIEPIYKTAIRQLDMEDSLSEATHRLGYPMMYAKVGDASHNPTENMIQKITDAIKNPKALSNFVVPYYVELSLLEAKRPEKLQEQLDYYIDMQLAGMGVPKAYGMSYGEATNRSTLDRQEAMYKLTMKDIILKTTKSIERNIFKPIAQTNGFKKWPKITWNEIDLNEMDSKTKRIIGLAGAGMITPDPKLESMLRKSEGLPTE